MEIPRHWRLKKQRYGLVGEVCSHCDKKNFPPRDVCPNCNGETIINLQESKFGDIFNTLPITTSLPMEASMTSK